MWFGFNKKALLSYCQNNNLTLEKFAEKYKIKLSTLNKFLKDSKNITISELYKIALVLELSVKTLLNEDYINSKFLIFE